RLFLYLFTVRRSPLSPLFPYTTLFRSWAAGSSGRAFRPQTVSEESVTPTITDTHRRALIVQGIRAPWVRSPRGTGIPRRVRNREDRKSTRLNSSHVSISYAVFCLKKKK